jgi:hypothetical protein
LDSLRDFTNPHNARKLYEIGSDAARIQVQRDHLPDGFKVDAASI